MPLTTSNPEIIDGIEYPYLGLSMAIMPEWQETNVGGMVAVELSLFRITEEGKVERAMRDDKPVTRGASIGNAFAPGDSDLATAVVGILSAVQGYITAKGL